MARPESNSGRPNSGVVGGDPYATGYLATRAYGGMFAWDETPVIGGVDAPYEFNVTGTTDPTFSNPSDFTFINDANELGNFGARVVWKSGTAMENITFDPIAGTITVAPGFDGVYDIRANGVIGTDNAQEWVAFRFTFGGLLIPVGAPALMKVLNVNSALSVTGIGVTNVPAGVPIGLAVAGSDNMQVECYQLTLSAEISKKAVL